MTDDLKSFKISDQVKPRVEPPKGKKPDEPEPAPGSAGFPKIEALVESDAPDLTGLEARQAQLEEMAKGKGSNKEKAGAKKAAAAYQRARELISYLLDTKQKMAAGPAQGPSGG